MPDRALTAGVGLTRSGAIVSDDGLYRYLLWREWDPARPVMAWVMLNPSTADHKHDDPTIRRCVGFAAREGCGSIQVVNLFALRTTKPEHLLDHPDPEGPGNAAAWGVALVDRAPEYVVAAWGHGATTSNLPPSEALARHRDVRFLCLGTTASGQPRHPLYVRAAKSLEVWV